MLTPLGPLLRALHELTHLVLPTILWDNSYYYPDFTDKDPEVEKLSNLPKVTQPRSRGRVLTWHLMPLFLITELYVVLLTNDKCFSTGYCLPNHAKDWKRTEKGFSQFVWATENLKVFKQAQPLPCIRFDQNGRLSIPQQAFTWKIKQVLL